jgi:hypothetical protein
MTADLDIDVSLGPVRAIGVPATAGPVTVIRGPCRLYGYSLQDAQADQEREVQGSVTSPGAGGTIATMTLIVKGRWYVNWTVELEGTVAAADADNFSLAGVNGGPAVSQNLGAVGVYPQQQQELDAIALSVLTVTAIAAGTVGAVYKVTLTLTPVPGQGISGSLQDGNSFLAMLETGAMGVDAKWFGPMGITVLNQITLVISNGTLQGAIYAAYYR